MLGAIKLPSSGVLQRPLPYVEVIGPNYLEVCGAVEPKRGRNQLSSRIYANKTLRHGSGNQHIWIKNGVDSNRKPEYTKGTPLVEAGNHYCKRVTSRRASQLIKLSTSKHFAAAKVLSSIP